MTKPEKTYTAEVIEDNGEYLLQFNPKMLDDLGWQEGDTIVWDIQPDAVIVLRKKDNAN